MNVSRWGSGLRANTQMKKTEIEIRDFETSDLDRLQRIRGRAFEPVFRSFRALTGEAIAKVAFVDDDKEQADLLTRLCDPGTPEQMFVALVDGEIVGFAAMSLDHQKKSGEIGLNAVDPDHAGRGIGTKLYRFVLDRMKAAGMQIATVGTGGDESHAPARRAYEKAGFGPSIPSVWMYRSL